MAFSRIACCALVALLCSVCAAAAQAAPVLVIGKDGRAREHRHSLTPATTFPPVRAIPPASRELAMVAKAKRTVPGELKRLRDAGQIDDATYGERLAAFNDARAKVKKLTGRR